MFSPYSFTVALLMTVTSTICWGSWANTYKGTRNYRFELFYWDYAVGIFAIALLLAFTLGSVHHDADSFLANVRSAAAANIGFALLFVAGGGGGKVRPHRCRHRPRTCPLGKTTAPRRHRRLLA
jgi:hypothetical protein